MKKNELANLVEKLALLTGEKMIEQGFFSKKTLAELSLLAEETAAKLDVLITNLREELHASKQTVSALQEQLAQQEPADVVMESSVESEHPLFDSLSSEMQDMINAIKLDPKNCISHYWQELGVSYHMEGRIHVYSVAFPVEYYNSHRQECYQFMGRLIKHCQSRNIFNRMENGCLSIRIRS